MKRFVCTLLLILTLAVPTYAEGDTDFDVADLIFSQFQLKRTSRFRVVVSPTFAGESFFPTGVKLKITICF